MIGQRTHHTGSSLFRIAVIMSVILALIASALAHGFARASGEEAPGEFRMSAITADCTFQTGGPLYGCTPWAGVVVTFVIEEGSGTRTETCTTVDPGGADARAASCGFAVAFGAVVTVSIDPAAIPAGYVLNQDATQVWTAPDGPPDGVTGQPIFTLTAHSAASTPDSVHHHLARIVSSSCAAPGTTIAELTPLFPSVGEPVGQASAIEAETSTSTIPAGLDGIIDGPSAVVIYESDGTDGTILACGDVGGVNDHDGELVILLAPTNGSGAVGVARLAYNQADAAMTDVTLYLMPLPA